MSKPVEERTQVPISVVREWARKVGYEVGSRGHLPQDVIKRYNYRHRTYAVNSNPNLPDTVES